MALTELQRHVCRLIAAHRKAGGESYIAGGVALNELLKGTRISRDIDSFHDTEAALAATWEADRHLLKSKGLAVEVLRERPGFVEARVRRDPDMVLVQWARDSAYRFFPLVEHAELGLTLHPFDLATNKVLALISRLEVRDWIDLLHCHRELQPLGYLAWAACGKDPGFGPLGILEEAARSSHYSAEEVGALEFDGPAPDARALSREWHAALAGARKIVAALPPDFAGQAVLAQDGNLFRGDPETLERVLRGGETRYRRGSIRGVLPEVKPEAS
jgi:hypothetical protein